jgi:hypothetical protein
MDASKRRLRLKTETLRELTHDDLCAARGGVITVTTDTVDTRRSCNVTDGCWTRPPPVAP